MLIKIGISLSTVFGVIFLITAILHFATGEMAVLLGVHSLVISALCFLLSGFIALLSYLHKRFKIVSRPEAAE